MTGRPALGILASPPGAEAYLALDKPAGRAVHGPGGLLAEVRGRFGNEISLVHRLDRETSGVLLFARGSAALAAALLVWDRDISKTYVARTRGIPVPSEGTIDVPLLEHRSGKPALLLRALRAAYGPSRAGHLVSGRRVGAIPPIPPPGRTASHPAGRKAATQYRVLSREGGTALVELRPRQGRMHQLRVHLLVLGTPLLGDRFYDPARSPDAPPPLLHALRLEWRNPPGAPEGTVWTWEAPVPRPPVDGR